MNHETKKLTMIGMLCAVASCIFAFQFDKRRTKYSNYNTSV